MRTSATAAARGWLRAHTDAAPDPDHGPSRRRGVRRRPARRSIAGRTDQAARARSRARAAESSSMSTTGVSRAGRLAAPPAGAEPRNQLTVELSLVGSGAGRATGRTPREGTNP
jgi:hypothetical protein